MLSDTIRLFKKIGVMYKYMPLDQNGLNNLIRGEIYFSDNSDLNDYYDCNLNYDFGGSEGQWYKYFKKKRISDTDENIKKRSWEIMGQDNNYKNKLLRDINDDYGVSCFSKNKDNIRMWGQYADKNKGVCIGFNTKIDCDFYSFPIIVDYETVYPKVNFFDYHLADNVDDYRSIKFEFGTKLCIWKDEEEVRIVKKGFRNKKGIQRCVKYPLELVTEIILGSRIELNSENLKTFKRLRDEFYPNAELLKAEYSEEEYCINFNKVL